MDIHSISSRAFDDEKATVEALLASTEDLAFSEKDILAKAGAWVDTIRHSGRGHGMEAFLQIYGLDTEEGVALMCLAEALLRIPDAATADQLINGTFEGRDWRGAISQDGSWFTSAASWGLLITGKIATPDAEGALHRLTTRLSAPIIRQALKQAMRIIGAQFVLGEDITQAIQNAAPWENKGYRFSYDILGEGARSDAQAQHYLNAYLDAVMHVGARAKDMPVHEAPGISVKLSALHPRYLLSQKERVMSELLIRLKKILLAAKEHNITVSIDAEEANRLDIELLLFCELFKDPLFKGWNGIGFVLQAYQKRAIHIIGLLRELAKEYDRTIPIRLVKGAYWDSEIKHAQVMGLPGYPVFTRKEHTDLSYLACARSILQNAEYFYPQFATHNARTIAAIQQMAAFYEVPRYDYEFQRLHGMGEKLHDQVLGENASRIYAPVGAHKDLLAYLIRRLLENGANTSFVHLLLDNEISTEELLADPITKAKEGKGTALALPADIYGDRKNSRGYDLGYLHLREGIENSLAPVSMDTNPTSDIEERINAAHKAFAAWSAKGAQEHAAIIEELAALFEEHTPQLISLLTSEGKKTIPDAISEVREAADMCRYYALKARELGSSRTLIGPTGELNQLSLHPRGVFACISPWNFPLAIFTGQIVAALVTGNCAIAKPAEQTPKIAAFAVSLMHRAGIPENVVQLAIGKGSIIGPALTSHPAIAGIVFTGSVEVAKSINRSIAERNGPIIPFIAETGGQNCMVVDSSALLEQAVDDIMLSAFGSAGQRCSALRVLYVQEEIADDLIALLKGAMQEISVGDPALLSTDVGPVIDEKAKNELMAHIDSMKHSATLIAHAPATRTQGSFVLPHAFEINDIRELTKENFGPVLHVIRFKASEKQKIADDINATGYGLTFGIHSRVQENIGFFLSHVHAGNHYVNRSMIGAVVGVQPFGGEGLSGTGPKAGGPYYLLRFLHERSISINSAAIGGNVALLSGPPGV